MMLAPATTPEAMDWPFEGLEPQKYKIILADPAWRFSSGPNKNPERHYRTMPIREIAKLPVRDLAHPDGCRLLLWATPPILLLPFGPREVMAAWGFRYSTVRVWGKLWPREDEMFIYPDSWSRGPGYETTGDAEFLIIGKRGRPQSLRTVAKPRGLFFARRREHSRKPDLIRDEIAQLFDGPRCELFSRSSHPGFDAWGHELGKFDGVNA